MPTRRNGEIGAGGSPDFVDTTTTNGTNGVRVGTNGIRVDFPEVDFFILSSLENKWRNSR